MNIESFILDHSEKRIAHGQRRTSYLISTLRWSSVCIAPLKALQLTQHTPEPKRSQCVSLVDSENPTVSFLFLFRHPHFILSGSEEGSALRFPRRPRAPDAVRYVEASKQDCALAAGGPLGLQRRERESSSAVRC